LSIACGKSVKYLTANAVEPVVYSGHSDGSVRIYSMTQGKTPIAQIKGIIDYPINYISLLSNRYQALVSSSEGSTIHLMDMKMNKSIGKFEHPDFFNTSVQADISPSETYAVAGNCDGAIYYWNTVKKAFEKRVSGHEGPINALKYNFMSGILASGDK
jgi:WD40 repeat protein